MICELNEDEVKRAIQLYFNEVLSDHRDVDDVKVATRDVGGALSPSLRLSVSLSPPVPKKEKKHD